MCFERICGKAVACALAYPRVVPGCMCHNERADGFYPFGVCQAEAGLHPASAYTLGRGHNGCVRSVGRWVLYGGIAGCAQRCAKEV